MCTPHRPGPLRVWHPAEAGAFELEAYRPGESCNGTFELEAGTYTVFCIVEAQDGSTHLSKGMEAELAVQ